VKLQENNYVESKIQGYIGDIFAVTERYMESLNQYFGPLKDLLKLRKSELEGSRTKVILILSQYGTKESLQGEVKDRREKVEDTRKNLNQIIELMKDILEKKDITCPECKGTGSTVKVKYIREGGIITPYFSTIRCQICKGEGRIVLPKRLEKYLALAVRMADKINQLGSLFVVTLDEIKTLIEL